jgi:hypothetical protein
MGDSTRWTDRFADWFVGLAYGKKFLLSLGLASITIVGPTLIATSLLHLGSDTQQVEIWCGSRKVTISRDDPIFEETNLEASAVRMCALPS